MLLAHPRADDESRKVGAARNGADSNSVRRACHSPKYFGSKGEGEHGRRMPWEQQPAGVKSHVGKAKQSPKPAKHHHHTLLSSRSLRADGGGGESWPTAATPNTSTAGGSRLTAAIPNTSTATVC